MSDAEPHLYEDRPICAECGGEDGIVHHVDIAWPGGRHVELWLHPECEIECIKRLEADRKP